MNSEGGVKLCIITLTYMKLAGIHLLRIGLGIQQLREKMLGYFLLILFAIILQIV